MTPGSAGAALMPAARTFVVFHPRLRAGDPRESALHLLTGTPRKWRSIVQVGEELGWITWAELVLAGGATR